MLPAGESIGEWCTKHSIAQPSNPSKLSRQYLSIDSFFALSAPPERIVTFSHISDSKSFLFLLRSGIWRFESMTGTLVLLLIYGIDEADSEPFIEMQEKAFSYVTEGLTPGNFWVVSLSTFVSKNSGDIYWIQEFFPWLKHVPSWFPGAGFKRKAKQSKVVVDATHEEPFRHAIKRMVGMADNWKVNHTFF
jgi:hypothetical protein